MKYTADEHEVWVEAYVRFYDNSESRDRDASDADFWAVERFITLGHEEPGDCWKAIIGILAKSPSSTVLANVAAGPLEDLIENHGVEFVDTIETNARKNPQFRNLLGGVWKCSSPEIWESVEKARNYTSW